MKILLQSPLRALDWPHLLSHFFTMSDENQVPAEVEVAPEAPAGSPEPVPASESAVETPVEAAPAVAVEPEAPSQV